MLLQSKEWIATLKMNGSVQDIAFFKDSTKMMSFGGMSYYIINMIYTVTSWLCSMDCLSDALISIF